MKAPLLAIAAVLLLQHAAHPQDAKKEHSALSTEQLRMMLDALNYDHQFKNGMFQVKLSKPGDNAVKYEVTVQALDHGQALVVSADLISSGVPVANAKQASKMLRDVNDWNIVTALTRGIRRQTTVKGKEIYFLRLEADLDCSHGVTQDDVNRLIQRFPAMIKDFETQVR